MDEPRIHAILRADLKGLPDSYIMEQMDISPHILNRIRSSDLYQERMVALQERADEQALDKVRDVDDPVQQVLVRAAECAAKKNVALLKDENPKIAQASAWDILDRTGHPKSTRTETAQRQVVTVDVETLKALGDALALTPKIAPEPDVCSMQSEGADEQSPV